jgi:Flp pilus assembly protein TadG
VNLRTRLFQGRSKPGHRRARGQSLAEFALVAPIFFLLVFAVLQVGLVMAAQNGLVDGVRSAARRAATYRINEQSFDPTVWSSICSTIDSELSTRLESRVIGFTGSLLTKSIAYEWQQNPGGGEYFLVAHITAAYHNPLYVPLVSAFLDRSDGTVDDRLTLTASEQMRVENPALDTPASLSAQSCP